MRTNNISTLFTVAAAISAATIHQAAGFAFAPKGHVGGKSFGTTSHLVSSTMTPTLSNTALSMAQRRGRPKGPLRTIEVKPPMNGEIEFDEIRVTQPSATGGKDESLGIMSKAEALAKAKEIGDDLILINENGDPPVCKIMDYSKYRYIKEKAAKEKKKNSKGSELKEIKMSYKIDVHDYEVRKRSTEKFVLQGNRVKCSVVFRGREIQHDDLGFDLLQRLANDLQHVLTMEGRPKKDGRNVSCMMSPRSDVLKKVNDKKRAAEKAKKKDKQKEKEDKRASKIGGVEADAAADEIDMEEDDDDDEDDDESVEDLIKGDAVTDDLFA